MRQLWTDKSTPMYGEFVARGRESSRLEQLSDCIFALAITMLLISTTPPKNFGELVTFVSDMLSFGICIVLVIWVWHGHYQFFLRFGLRNMSIIVLNTALMIVILFYVYPLKFLMSFLVDFLSISLKGLVVDSTYFNELNGIRDKIAWEQMPSLLLIYNVGFVSIFTIFILMHRQVIKSRVSLDLSPTEEIKTRSIIAHYTGITVLALISTVIAFIGIIIDWSFAGLFGGIIYFLIGPVSYIIERRYERRLASSTKEATTSV